MNKSVGMSDIHLFTELDMVYNQVRVLEARQNETKFKCLGSGQCCKIGLILPMMECASIAFNLNKEYSHRPLMFVCKMLLEKTHQSYIFVVIHLF